MNSYTYPTSLFCPPKNSVIASKNHGELLGYTRDLSRFDGVLVSLPLCLFG